MSGSDFKKIIEYYGEQNIIGIGFDNSAAITFSSGQFSLNEMYVEELECFRHIEFDSKGRPYHVIKPIDTVQCILVKDASVNFDDYDRISVRP